LPGLALGCIDACRDVYLLHGSSLLHINNTEAQRKVFKYIINGLKVIIELELEVLQPVALFLLQSASEILPKRYIMKEKEDID
jgi:hypothetical protein